MAIWVWGQALWGSGVWSSIPSRMADPIEEDVPRARNYRVALASTTQPIGPVGPAPGTPTPTPWADWSLQDDRPIAPYTRRAVLSPAIAAPFFIPPPFLPCDLSLQDDRPIARDYRAALISTTIPVLPVFLPPVKFDSGGPVSRRKGGYWPALQASTRPIWTPFVPPSPVSTPSPMVDLSLQDDLPVRADYRAVLGSTTSSRFTLLPPPPISQPMAIVITPDPRRPDYSRALEATTHPVGQLIGVVPVGTTPSIWWRPPDQPVPLSGNYRAALEASSRPILVTSFRTAVTPTRFFASPLEPLPLARNYLTALWSTSGVKNISEPPPPPPPPPVSCVVQELPGIDQGHVTLAGAGATAPTLLAAQPVPGAVSLTGGTQTTQPLSPAADKGTVPFVANPHCP